MTTGRINQVAAVECEFESLWKKLPKAGRFSSFHKLRNSQRNSQLSVAHNSLQHQELASERARAPAENDLKLHQRYIVLVFFKTLTILPRHRSPDMRQVGGIRYQCFFLLVYS